MNRPGAWVLLVGMLLLAGCAQSNGGGGPGSGTPVVVVTKTVMASVEPAATPASSAFIGDASRVRARRVGGRRRRFLQHPGAETGRHALVVGPQRLRATRPGHRRCRRRSDPAPGRPPPRLDGGVRGLRRQLRAAHRRHPLGLGQQQRLRWQSRPRDGRQGHGVRHHHPPRQMVPDKGRPCGRLGGSLRRLPARGGDEEGRQPVGLGGQLLRSPRSAGQHQYGRRPDRGRQWKGLGDRRGRRRLLPGRQGRRQPVGHRLQHVRQPRPRRHRRQASADSGRQHQRLGGRLGRARLRPGPQEGRQPLGLGREQLRSARGRRHRATAQPDAGRQRDRLGGGLLPRPPQPGAETGRHALGVGREQLRSARGRRHGRQAQSDAGGHVPRLGRHRPRRAPPRTTVWR